MPVSTGQNGEPRSKRCKFCDESNHKNESEPSFWHIQLDRDLLDTISAIYPEWFQTNMTEGKESTNLTREVSPDVIIDTSPLHINQNKESLKVKLMLRRPLDQLVAQGILPPHKSPVQYHGQRKQLERAKTGDMLKAKIQQRPPRQELERRHILETERPHIDPSLAEKQRLLKKAKLADQLNDQISHRPGPLELIQKNILHTEESIEQAVKTGQIPYKATSEGQLNRPLHPHSYITPDEESLSSDNGNLVISSLHSNNASDGIIDTAATPTGIVVSVIPAPEKIVKAESSNDSGISFVDLRQSLSGPLLSHVSVCSSSVSSPASSLLSSTSTLSPLSSICSPLPCLTSHTSSTIPVPPPLPILTSTKPSHQQYKSDAPGKDKNRKKSKSKVLPKARTIKFHEYKGPPNTQRNLNSSNGTGESSYEILLQQQALLLQFQLQLQHKYPQIILPAQSSSDNNNSNSSCNSSNNNSISQKIHSIASPPPAAPPTPIVVNSSDSSVVASTKINPNRLDEMKVCDLKAELKRRNLPVSGSKPRLIDRLKSFTTTNRDTEATTKSEIGALDQIIESPKNPHVYQTPEEQNVVEKMDISEPLSPTPVKRMEESIAQYTLSQKSQQDQDTDTVMNTNQDIVREQQRQIQELQRELTISQLRLQAVTRNDTKTELLALQKHIQARQNQNRANLAIAQIQSTQCDQVQDGIPRQGQKAIIHNDNNLSTRNSLLLIKSEETVPNVVHTNSEPNRKDLVKSEPIFNNSLVPPNITEQLIESHYNAESNLESSIYDNLSKQADSKNVPNKKYNIKSEIVDDVLEILIKNGELSPSAVNDPSTPIANKCKELVFPMQPSNIVTTNSSELEASLNLDPAEVLESLDNLDMDFTQFVMDLGNMNQHENATNTNESLPVAMETEDWLQSLCSYEGEANHIPSAALTTQDNKLLDYDPLIGLAQETFDPFNLDEFRSSNDLPSTLTWDKIDYAV